nr:hypothetical protein [uncultured bacterium]
MERLVETAATRGAAAPAREKRRIQTMFRRMHAVLSLYLTNKCNILCGHCGVESGPHESTLLAPEDTLAHINALASGGGLEAIHVSGGEPFLYRNRMRMIAACGLAANVQVAVNTNGFWSRQPERAGAMLDSMPGLTQIILSTDEYHEPFLGLEVVRDAARIALSRELLVDIYVCTPAGRRTEFVERLESYMGEELLARVPVVVTTLEPGGRADLVPEAHWRERSRNLPSGRCDLVNRPVVLEDGDVLACCNTTVAKRCKRSPLVVGNTHREALPDILRRAREDTLLQAIRIFGPRFVAERLDTDERARLGGEYRDGDICALCSDIMSDARLTEGAIQACGAEETQRLVAIGRALLAGEPDL